MNGYGFLRNWEGDCVGKMGREYNKLDIKHASFEEFWVALKGEEGGRIGGN